MKIELILKLVCFIAGIIVSGVPMLITAIRSIKKYRLAKTDAEKEAARNDMLGKVNVLIQAAEETYKGVNDILKTKNDSAGPVKKDSVLTKLQAYALENGYSFDLTYWSDKIDEIVSLTKSVN